MDSVKLTLRNPDFTTARRVSQAVNAFLGTAAAVPSDPSTVHLKVPDSYTDNVVNLLTDIEQLRVEPDQLARVVIDEQSGTIVMGENVRISTVAIAQGSLRYGSLKLSKYLSPAPLPKLARQPPLLEQTLKLMKAKTSNSQFYSLASPYKSLLMA